MNNLDKDGFKIYEMIMYYLMEYILNHKQKLLIKIFY